MRAGLPLLDDACLRTGLALLDWTGAPAGVSARSNVKASVTLGKASTWGGSCGMEAAVGERQYAAGFRCTRPLGPSGALRRVCRMPCATMSARGGGNAGAPTGAGTTAL